MAQHESKHWMNRLLLWITSHELATVLLVGIVGIGVLGFVELADEVTEGESIKFDRQILLLLRDTGDSRDPIGPSWFEEMARDITALGSVVVLTIFTASAACYLWLTKQNWIAKFVVCAVLLGVLFSSALKMGFNRPRPDLVPHATQVYTKSFPSGHSSMSALVYLTLGALVMRVQKQKRVRSFFLSLAIFLAFFVGLSRIYLGVHWPTDVLAGWVFGTTWSAASWIVFRSIERRQNRLNLTGSVS